MTHRQNWYLVHILKLQMEILHVNNQSKSRKIPYSIDRELNFYVFFIIGRGSIRFCNGSILAIIVQ